MNRRLHTPIFACTASAASLVVGLLLAWPALSAEDARIEAGPAGMVKVNEDPRTPPGVGAASQDAAPAAPSRNRSKRARSAIAMPYFSFARGTGGRS